MTTRPVFEQLFTETGRFWGLRFYCPGCKTSHIITLPHWEWNGSLERPTITPSFLAQYNGSDAPSRCHLFIRDGQVQFLSDCAHPLAGQTLPLPPIEPLSNES